MRRFTLPILLILGLVFSSTAWAGVKLRAGVRPDTLKQCYSGKAFVAIGNTGERPIHIRISLALVSAAEAPVLGPYYGRLVLAAGEKRMREFRFDIPKDVPKGDFAWVVRALSNDITRDLAEAPFTVLANDCTGPRSSTESIIDQLGLEPDDEAAKSHDPSWGEVKRRYQK